MTNANPLLTDSIPKLIRRIGLPVAVGVLFNNLFQVADTFFAGMISKEALAALTLSFPLYFIIIGLSSGLGTGASALIGNALGAGKSEAAAHIAAQGLTLTVALSLLTASVGIAVAPAVFQSLGATGNALRFNMRYITPIFAGTIFFNLVFMFNAALSAQGNTRPFRNFLVLGFLLNLLLDPWFIFGGFGLPAMGIAGVGVATALIQAVGAVYLGITTRRSELFRHARPRMLAPDLAQNHGHHSPGYATGARSEHGVNWHLCGHVFCQPLWHRCSSRWDSSDSLPCAGSNDRCCRWPSA